MRLWKHVKRKCTFQRAGSAPIAKRRGLCTFVDLRTPIFGLFDGLACVKYLRFESGFTRE